MESFEPLLLVSKETIIKPETIDAKNTGIERTILGGTDKKSFLNKGNET